MERKKHIVLISTGGTIASRYDERTGRVETVASGHELISAIPEIGMYADVEVETVFTVPSFCLQPVHLMTLVDAIRRHLSKAKVDGIVVTHGTDTMEESSFFVDLLIDNQVPIVFTGAQLSADMRGADGPRNLVNSIRLAVSDSAMSLGTLVCFADGIYDALDVVKLHTSRLDAFGSKRGSPVGEITRDEVIFYGVHRSRVTYPVRELTTDVSLIRLVLGMDVEYLSFCLKNGIKGLVLQAFGIGNATPDIVDLVGEAVADGIPVIVTSRCVSGRVTPVYGSGGGKDLLDVGAVFAGDLSGEKARLALMVLISACNDLSEVSDEIKKIAG